MKKILIEIITKYKMLMFLAILESFFNLVKEYAPLFMISIFLQACLNENMEEAFIYGGIYFGIYCLGGIIVGCIQEKRILKSRIVNEQMINRLYEKIHKISYEDFVDADNRQKYLTAIEILYYEFDYSDVINELVIIFENILNIVLSAMLTISLIFSIPQIQSRGIGWLADPVIGFGATVTVLVVLMIYGTVIGKKYNEKKEKLLQSHVVCENKIAYLQNKIVYNFEQYSTYHIFNMEKLFEKRFDEATDNNLDYFRKSRNNLTRYIMNTDISFSISTFYSFLLTTAKVLTGAISPAYFITYGSGMIKMQNAIIELVNSYEKIIQNAIYFQMIDDIFMLKDEDKKNGESLNIETKDIIIEFSHVSYRYPKAIKYAIKDISFVMKSDKKHVLVGENGSGKTTLLLLLGGILKPTEGAIYINGHDISSLSQQEYRSIMSFVLQDGGIYPMSVGENISFQKSSDKKCLLEALLQATVKVSLENVDEFIEGNIEGLSGGEKQKILAARAFYRDSQVLILDEPTAAMDPLSENQFYRSLFHIAKEHFVIFVSHRMSSCLECEDIIVLSEGKIKERGNHTKLMKKAGLYAELWKAQALGYSR